VEEKMINPIEKLHRNSITSLLFIFSFANVTFAQTKLASDSIKYAFPEISVTADRLKPTEASINLNRIEKLIPEQIEDAFSLLPGVISTPEGSAGQEIVIRGVSQNRINIFYNGVPIRSNTFNNIPLDGLLFLNAENIILETGSPSLIYGANSSGNVLYLKTSPFSQKRFSFGLTSYTGNNAKQGHRLMVSGFTPKIHYKLSGGYYTRDSFRLSDKFESTPSQTSSNRVNSDLQNIEFAGMITPVLSQNHIYSLFGSLNSSEYGRPPSTVSRSRYRRMDYWQNAFVAVNGASSLASNLNLENIVYYTSLKDTVTRYNDPHYSEVRSYSYWKDQTIGGRSILSKEFNSHNFAHASVDIKRDIHQQDWHSKSETKSTTSIMTLGLKNRSIKNVSIAPDVSFNHVRPNYSSENSDLERKKFSAFNYKLLATYSNAVAGYELYAGLSYTTIFFSTIDLFGDALRSDDWYKIIPNPNLKEEKSRNFDFGTKLYLEDMGLNIGLSIYYNRLTDLINAVSLSDSTEQSINIAAARNAGFDVVVEYDVLNNLKTYLTYSYLDARNLSTDRTSDQLSYLPKHRLKLYAAIVPLKLTQLSVIATYVSGRQYEIMGNWDTLDSYLVIDGILHLNLLKNVGCFLVINNILDENYDSLYGYPQPGRELIFGLKLNY
jgi:iron complex outermembrane receptor protein